MSLGSVVQQSTSISEVQVVKVDKEKNLILFRKVKDIKGTLPVETLEATTSGVLVSTNGNGSRLWNGRNRGVPRYSLTTGGPAKRALALTGIRRTPRASGGI